jgi:hypothetical protein
MTFQEAFKVFAKELRRDKGLYRAYQANIAMAYYDCAHWEGSRDSSAKRHAIGNRAADYFLKLLLTPVRPQSKRSRQAHPPTQLCQNNSEKLGRNHFSLKAVTSA